MVLGERMDMGKEKAWAFLRTNAMLTIVALAMFTEEDASVVKQGRPCTLEVPLWDIVMNCNACYLDAVYGAF